MFERQLGELSLGELWRSTACEGSWEMTEVMAENDLSLDIIRGAANGELSTFSLRFPGRESLVCEQVFRHLPGRRVVFKARWSHADVLVKLFFNRKDYLREKHGIALLEKHGIPSPTQIWCLEDKQTFFVATEFFNDAESLLLRCRDDGDGVDEKGVQQVLTIIGRMHQVGLVQQDIHLDNFLFSGGQAYVIDGASVEAYENLKNKMALKNVALFFAQLPPLFDKKIPQILSAYDGLVSFSPEIPEQSLGFLLKEVINKRLWRIRKYQKKSLRSCSEFVADQSWQRLLVMRRDCDDETLRKLLEEPDANVGQGRLLKNGHTATVLEIAGSDGAKWVLKRYNIKGWAHGLSRCWRPSRAWRSWQNAQALAVIGVPTPKPIAFRENRTGRLRQEAYLITESIDGSLLDQWLLKRPRHDVPQWLDAAILDVFFSLLGSRISHGDMKSTNFIVTSNNLVLIDLDSMCVHRNERTFYRAFRKDMERFMANWHGDTHRHFSQLLRPIFQQIGLDAPALRN